MTAIIWNMYHPQKMITSSLQFFLLLT